MKLQVKDEQQILDLIKSIEVISEILTHKIPVNSTRKINEALKNLRNSSSFQMIVAKLRIK